MKNYGVLGAIIVCACIVACSKNSGEQSAVEPVVRSTPVDIEHSQTPRAKPGLAITLSLPQQRIEVGLPTEIDLSLTTGVNEGVLNVNITLPPELQLINGATTQVFDLSNERPEIAIEVYAEQPGKYYLPIVAELDRGQHRGRVVSAIIWAGDVELLRAQHQQGKPESNNLIEMPATETIY